MREKIARALVSTLSAIDLLGMVSREDIAIETISRQQWPAMTINLLEETREVIANDVFSSLLACELIVLTQKPFQDSRRNELIDAITQAIDNNFTLTGLVTRAMVETVTLETDQDPYGRIVIRLIVEYCYSRATH